MNLQQLNLHLKGYTARLVFKAATALLFGLKARTLHTEAEISSLHVGECCGISDSASVWLTQTESKGGVGAVLMQLIHALRWFVMLILFAIFYLSAA